MFRGLEHDQVASHRVLICWEARESFPRMADDLPNVETLLPGGRCWSSSRASSTCERSETQTNTVAPPSNLS